jgi:hypothetical protein
MAEGLSIPALSPVIDQGFRSFLERTGGGASALLPESNTINTEAPASEGGFLGDLLDFGKGLFNPSGVIPPGQFQLEPGGTYQFSRFAASASIDFSLSQSDLEVSNGADGTTARVSSELNLSISVPSSSSRR